MGNNTGKPLSNQTEVSATEIDSIIDRINRLSNSLYKMYGLNFTDNKFCNRVAITYEKKLGQLPMYKLAEIDKSLNKPQEEGRTQMEAFLKYEPKVNEKFIVNDLKENLVDFFTDKNIDFATIDQINTSVPNIKYIHPKTLASLRQSGGADPNAALTKLLNTLPQNQPQRPPQQQQQFRRDKKFRPPRENRQPRPNRPQENRSTPRENRQPRTNRPPQENRPPHPNQPSNKQLTVNKQNQPKDVLPSLEEMMLENNVKLSNMENTTKPKTYLNETQEVKKLLEGEKKEIKKEFANIAKNEATMTEVLNKREKNIKAVNLPKTESIPQGLANINKKLTCGKDEKECYLTQAELCERISKYYLLKGNIIAVILSAIPRKKDGKLVGSFCYNRFQALKDGRLCLPPGINELENMSLENKLRRLSKFINNMDEYQCKSVSGYYRVLNEKEKTALVTNDTKFNKYYILYTAKLYNQYLESLRQLMGILEILESDYTINSGKLNEIAIKVKTVVDSMHTMCQFNYISAILAYLRADLDVSQRDRKEQDKEINELEKGLKL